MTKGLNKLKLRDQEVMTSLQRKVAPVLPLVNVHYTFTSKPRSTSQAA